MSQTAHLVHDIPDLYLIDHPFVGCRPSEQAGTDILYYAVNSMNLTPESALNQNEPITSRVTFDAASAQEALNRSFQPFTQHLYESKTSKRPATTEAMTHASKRLHEDGGEYEVRAGDYVLT